jgi:predicted O-methyltransferase YrrM
METIIQTCLILGVLLGIAALFNRRIKRLNRSLRELQSAIDKIPPFIWATESVFKNVEPGHTLPNWNNWSMPPDTLAFVIDHIKAEKPKNIVEFGSGISTIVIASLIKDYGGMLTSYEHDEAYAKVQQTNLSKRDLSNWVDLQIASIGSELHQPFSLPWYEIPKLEELNDIDLVLIDGPLRSFGAEVRFPGADLLIPRLRPGGLVIFDDADRNGEQNIKFALIKKYPNMLVIEPPSIRGCLILQKPN